MTKISCSIRRLIAAGSLSGAVAAALAGAVGCSTQEKVVYDSVNTKPIVGDDAMALRSNWPRSVSYYPNGDVAAWSTRFPYQTNESRADTANLVLDTVTFIGETAFLPVELVANPPFQPQVWYGVKYPPTYTAQPILPPSSGNVPPPGGPIYTGRTQGSGQY